MQTIVSRHCHRRLLLISTHGSTRLLLLLLLRRHFCHYCNLQHSYKYKYDIFIQMSKVGESVGQMLLMLY